MAEPSSGVAADPRLARVGAQLAAMKDESSYRAFAAFVREGPARRWICAKLGLSPEELTDAIEVLDRRQAEWLPERMDDIGPRLKGAIRAVYELVSTQLRKKGAKGVLFAVSGEMQEGGRSAPAGSSGATPATLEGWRLKLPVPPERRVLETASPSSLDAYLACPFTYYLRQLFGERTDYGAEELDPAEFGRLAHDALEAWAGGEMRDSDDEAGIGADLAARVDALLHERFGDHVPAKVALQGEGLKGRFALFASAQAARRRAGWRIVAVERRLQAMFGHTLVKGRCDRVDRNEATGEWCVVDYKTWSSPGKARFRDEVTGELTNLQLPLYCAMLAGDPDPMFAEARMGNISSAYCLVAKSAEDTGFKEPVRYDDGLARETERAVLGLADRMERGIYWPPSASAWRHDFGRWFSGPLSDCVDKAWLEDQERRLGGAVAECPAASADRWHPAFGGFLDLVALADHPGDRQTYRHFATTPLASAKYPDGVPSAREVSTWAAYEFAESGLAGAFRALRGLLPSSSGAAEEAQFEDLLRAAARFESSMGPCDALSGFVAACREQPAP